MVWTLLVLVITQAIYTTSDYLARSNMQRLGFTLSAFGSFWFAIYFSIRLVAMTGQLYVYSQTPLSRGSLLYAVVATLLTPAVGIIFLHEPLTRNTLIGAAFAVLAIIFLTR